MGWLRKYGYLDWTLPQLNAMDINKELSPEQKIKQLEEEFNDEQDRNLIYKTIFDILRKEQAKNGIIPSMTYEYDMATRML